MVKGTPTNNTWKMMVQRCCNPNHQAFDRYGGAGITVCERWRTYKNFLADMGERPEGKTLDRIDGKGNYEPGNCRWATWEEQHANKDWALKIDGEMLIRLCEERGLPYQTIWTRIKRYGWSVEDALNRPLRQYRRRPQQAA